MRVQFKYSLRQGLAPRLIALGVLVLLNLFFWIGGAGGRFGMAYTITATSVSALAFSGAMVVCFILDFLLIRSLFSAPAGYLVFLTPVPGWKILLSRVLQMLAFDLVIFWVGVGGIVLQALPFGDGSGYPADWPFTIWSCFIICLQYLTALLAVFFAVAVCKSLLYRAKGKLILGLLVLIGVGLACSWLNLVLYPLGRVVSWSGAVNINMTFGLNAGTIIYTLLTPAKAAALFFPTAYLMERRINL